jgi:hypothetical protein
VRLEPAASLGAGLVLVLEPVQHLLLVLSFHHLLPVVHLLLVRLAPMLRLLLLALLLLVPRALVLLPLLAGLPFLVAAAAAAAGLWATAGQQRWQMRAGDRVATFLRDGRLWPAAPAAAAAAAASGGAASGAAPGIQGGASPNAVVTQGRRQARSLLPWAGPGAELSSRARAGRGGAPTCPLTLP